MTEKWSYGIKKSGGGGGAVPKFQVAPTLGLGKSTTAFPTKTTYLNFQLEPREIT